MSAQKHTVPPLGTEVADLARDYAQYIQVPAVHEKCGRAISKNVELMLTRLDEFSAVADQLHGETSATVNDLVPKLVEEAEELRRIYALIDQLYAFVKSVHGTVNIAEERVNEAESAYNAIARKRMLSFIPGLDTSEEMPPFKGLEQPDYKEFVAQFRKGGRGLQRPHVSGASSTSPAAASSSSSSASSSSSSSSTSSSAAAAAAPASGADGES
eukprot:TRINITY_DN3053_c0_g1_i3.p1 TRINITY_DN3053_c0_g1~~TRINITY_DN3053_c0_g1_i3.p1  ORF type:complete len:214 (+),score=72.44 TRINITY_DN3053_c0_g1_i3:132-773(+)